ncbi:MAG: transposase [Bacillota bacterium]|nr:transposase [Thermanaerosceptrum fracticalcis]
MPRYARMWSDSRIYHVMLRGNNRENIFIDDADKNRIIDTLRDKKAEGEYYLFAYCVMDNHIHLVIKEGTDSLPRSIKRIAASYAYYFNKKYRRIGHVFQDRYRSENIEDDRYLLAVIRYVHQNPLKAGIGSIEKYKWSSYKEYVNRKSGMVETDGILEMFSEDKEKAIKEFARFSHDTAVEVFIDIGEEKEIDETNVNEYINKFLKEKGVELKGLSQVTNRKIREELIQLLLAKSNLSRRGIAAILELNREMVRRASVSREPSP